MQLRTYQKDAVNNILQSWDNGVNRGVVVMPTGTGKCFAKGTMVRMFDGSVKAIENIEDGDLVMGPDLNPRSVYGLAHGEDVMYDITATGGESFCVNSEHILALLGERPVEISVKDYLERGDDKLRLYKVEIPSLSRKVRLDYEKYFKGAFALIPSSLNAECDMGSLGVFPVMEKDFMTYGYQRTSRFTVTPRGTGEYYGFAIREPDGLFLLANGTVVHNTVVFSHVIEEAVRRWPDRKIVVVAHRDELLDQAMNKILAVSPGLVISKEKARERYDQNSQVIVASIQSVGRKGSKRLEGIHPSLIIIDECHHAAADTYVNMVESLNGYENCKVLGFTATPARFDKKALYGEGGAVFESEIFNYSIRSAVKDGWLCPIRGIRVRTEVDITDVRMSKGDFMVSDLERAFEDTNRNDIIYDKWMEYASDRLTLAFCSSVDLAMDMAEYFKSKGVKADSVDGTMPQEQRRDVMERFSRGEIRFLTNVQLITEGVDIPCIDCVVQAAPTRSWSRFVQEVGRGTRLFSGKKDLLVIDVVDNSKHSLVTLPSMIGLPSELDLEGERLDVVSDLVENAGIRASVLESRPPKTLDELRLRIEEFDMLAVTIPDDEVAKLTKFRWIRIPGDGLAISLGKEGTVRIVPDSVGNYKVNTSINGEDDEWVETRELEEFLPEFEAAIEREFPDIIKLIDKKAKWIKDPITGAQKRLLARLGVSKDIYDVLSKGEACDLIGHQLASGKKPKALPYFVR